MTSGASQLGDHGAFTRGASIPAAILALIVLEHLCRRNLEVLWAGTGAGVTPRAVPIEVAQEIRRQQRGLSAPEGKRQSRNVVGFVQ